MKFGSVGAELFHVDGQTESGMDGQTTHKMKPIIVFSKTVKSA